MVKGEEGFVGEEDVEGKKRRKGSKGSLARVKHGPGSESTDLPSVRVCLCLQKLMNCTNWHGPGSKSTDRVLVGTDRVPRPGLPREIGTLSSPLMQGQHGPGSETRTTKWSVLMLILL
jgi:hypothetical protein